MNQIIGAPSAKHKRRKVKLSKMLQIAPSPALTIARVKAIVGHQWVLAGCRLERGDLDDHHDAAA